jgi:Zn-dependent protease
MIGGVRICSFFGFEVRLDISWFVVFLLVLWTFAQSEFPRWIPGQTPLQYVIMAWAGALLFFGSVLFHELAHAAMARARGIPVEGITLFVFGGMARIRADAENPKDEFLITVVGPLTSAALGGLFLAIAYAGRALGAPPAVTGVAHYLAILNLILAVFNLIPGFPLDGGRLFRSLVWHVTRDLRKATRWASYSGRGFGLLMVGLGVVYMFRGALLAGMWLIFIGWFLTQAAESGYRQLILRRILEGVRAREAMTRSPETVRPDITLRDLVDDYFLKRRYNAFPVEDNDGVLLGIITLTQVKTVDRDLWPTTTVASAMMPVSDALTVRADDSLAAVLSKLDRTGVGRALVLDGGHLEGVITPLDVSHWLERYQQLH